jgi:hypothetical protein
LLLNAALCAWTTSRVVHFILLLVVSGALTLFLNIPELLILGICMVVAYAAALIIFFPKIVQCVGTLLCILSLVIQVVLGKTCGGDGYQDCYRSCPLPNPRTFNHNALFHCTWAIALLAIASGERTDPKIAYWKDDD